MSKVEKTKEATKSIDNTPEQDLMTILNSIDLKVKDRQVVQVLGENELVFEEGQFFLEETRNPKKRKQLSRNAAKEILMDFAIKYNSKKKKIHKIKE